MWFIALKALKNYIKNAPILPQDDFENFYTFYSFILLKKRMQIYRYQQKSLRGSFSSGHTKEMS